jgi:hypothetical protein
MDPQEATMTDEPGGQEPRRTSATRGRRYKPQVLELAGGSRLVLAADGAIDQIDERGTTLQRWTPDDPAWPDEAIRFGLHPQAPTVAPHGRVEGSRPPRR